MSGSSLLPQLREPSLIVLVEGVPLLGAIEAEVCSTNFLGADRFAVRLALGADYGFDAGFWSAVTSVPVEVRIGTAGPASAVSLIQGAADLVEIDVLRGTVLIEGRDLTARLIERRTQDIYANRTASEIATLLAQGAGLTPNVTATQTPVGRYYQGEHDRLTLDRYSRTTTDWDLLVFLAQQEGFDVFVAGEGLFFQPPATSVPPVPVDVSSLQALRMEHALPLAAGISVTVKSWNSRQQSMITATAGTASPSAATDAGVRDYVSVRPNLTPDQAQAVAQVRLAELVSHERVITARMPGELTITPRTLIQLSGSGTAFDQPYAVDEVTRRIGEACGFVQTVRARAASGAAALVPSPLAGVVAYS